ncbi:HAD hydrolase family protein [bacterium]|nr:HAD hydrolase family protein [bacterium]
MREAAVPFQKLKSIRVVLLDVDGILTDGRILLGNAADGSTFEMKSFHAHDGQGLIFAGKLGYEVGLVTSRESPLVARRAQELGIRHVFQNARDKAAVVKKFLADQRYKPEEFLFMGDDLLDLPVLLFAGFSATVPGAPREIRDRVDYVTDLPGGSGAVREVLELLFKVQGKWSGLLREFSEKI